MIGKELLLEDFVWWEGQNKSINIKNASKNKEDKCSCYFIIRKDLNAILNDCSKNGNVIDDFVKNKQNVDSQILITHISLAHVKNETHY